MKPVGMSNLQYGNSIEIQCRCGVSYLIFTKPDTRYARLRVYYVTCPVCGYGWNKGMWRKKEVRCRICNIPKRCFRKDYFFTKSSRCRYCVQALKVGKKPPLLVLN